MTISVVQGDCVDVLRGRVGPLFDSCVCDPPYELGFMGRAWDASGVAFRAETWRAIFDQMKPGAQLVAFSGTRTYHRMAVAIEDAGFEIRDQLAWAYGSGFPKSLDVSKAVDKHDATIVRRERALRFTEWMRSTGITAADIAELTQSRMASHYLTAKEQPTIATREHLEAMRSRLGVVPEWVEDVVEDRVVESENFKAREVLATATGKDEKAGDLYRPGSGNYLSTEFNITAAHSPEAAAWDGWGTALKPAWEPICLARKPLIGTVAANVLAHGTGGLNIDACRVEGEPWQAHAATGLASRKFFTDGDAPVVEKSPHNLGRFPANLLHDGSAEVEALFPQSGGQQGYVGPEQGARPSAGVYGDFGARPPSQPRGDTGSAARFFYSAKAGPLDRLGSEHPTIKPVDVMRWLVRLVTRPGGLLLDPFAGSGTTGIAALAEGVNAELIDLEPAHVADIETKLAHLRGDGGRIVERHLKRKASRAPAAPMFGGLL